MQISTFKDPSSGMPKTISRLGLGCSRVGSLGNPAAPEALRALMVRALDLGVTVFDTADIYGQGDSEREIGRALGSRRDEAFVVTKFGKRFSPVMRALRPLKPAIKPLLALAGAGRAVSAQREGVMMEDFEPKGLIKRLEGSLRRLRFDYVDAVLLHSPPLSVLTDDRVIEALRQIRQSGKARHVGASIETAEELAAALRQDLLTVIQIPINLAAELETPASTARLRTGEVTIFAREIIRLQHDLPPSEAVAHALTCRHVSGLIVGTTRQAHLENLVTAVSKGQALSTV